MAIEEQLIELASLYSQLMRGHYKNRDGVFGIDQYINGWERQAQWTARTIGYIHDEWSKTVPTYREAQEALRDRLVWQIEDRLADAPKESIQEQMDNSGWLGPDPDFHLTQAEIEEYKQHLMEIIR